MKIIELTHTISGDMPVYPGTASPEVKPANTIETDGFRETYLSMVSHTGTHMDAPAHIICGAQTLDAFAPEKFMGKAAVIDCRDIPAGGKIDAARVKNALKKLAGCEFILFNTGWDKYWGAEEYFGEFPVCEKEAIRLITDAKIKGIGVDAISIDPVADSSLTLHHLVLGSNMVIIENLTNLGCLPEEITFIALPLKYENADGAPVRAVAVY